MSLWVRKDAVGLRRPAEKPKEVSEAMRKAARLGQGERVDFADALVSEIGRSLVGHRHHTMTGDFLRTALRDAQALVGVLTVAVDYLSTPPPAATPQPSADLGVASVRQG